MVHLIEGTHNKRRKTQPLPTPHKSKDVVECLLWSDPGDDDDAQGDQTRRKMSKSFFWKCSQEKVEADRAKHSP